MDRRAVTVLGISLVFALVVSAGFYHLTVRAGNRPRQPGGEREDVVIAAQALPVGVIVRANDVKIAKVTADRFPKGAFRIPEEVIGRPVVSAILLEEPVMEERLAARGGGLGLSAVIPQGMRAAAVRVNDVAGVAGFVLPGMRVDVLATGTPPGYNGLVTSTALQNIQVLSAGENIQPDARGKPVNVPVVTLLVTPAQAETLTLAGVEGHIQLILRNGSDQKIEKPPGREISELYGTVKIPVSAKSPASPKNSWAHTETRQEAAREVAAAPPTPYEVVVIRGIQKTIEILPSDPDDGEERR
jgi:pilus assembly protein CpaB